MSLGAAVLANAQGDSLADCRQLETLLERYACYEQLEAPGGSNAGESAPATSVPAARPEPGLPVVQRPAAGESDEDESLLKRLWPFGGDDETGQQQQAPAETAGPVPSSELDSYGLASRDAELARNEKGQQELHDTVAALEQAGYQRWQVTLTSGQVWRQMIGESYRLEVGDEIRIYPSGWGDSYRLTAARLGKFIQVQRIK